jgi:hypothetical protein
LKGNIAKIISKKLFQNIDIHNIARFNNSFHVFPKRYFFLVDERLEVHLTAIEKILPFFCGYKGGDHTAGAATCDYCWHAVSLHQDLDHAYVVHTQNCTTT